MAVELEGIFDLQGLFLVVGLFRLGLELEFLVGVCEFVSQSEGGVHPPLDFPLVDLSVSD